MSWYGWIPIITSTLLVEKVIRDLRRSSLSTETRNEYLLLPKIDQAELIPLSEQDKQKYKHSFDQSTRATMRSHLEPASTDEVYYYLRDFDDKDTTNLHRVAVIINNDGFVKNSYFAQKAFRKIYKHVISAHANYNFVIYIH